MYSVLDSLRNEWSRVGRTKSSREAARRLDERRLDLELTYANDLFDVVELCSRGGGRNALERAEIVNAMLEEATDPDIHRALIQTLLPGVVQVCRELQFGRGVMEHTEFVSTAIALLSELLVDWAGQTRQYAAPDILSATRRRLRRAMLKEKDAVGRLSLFEASDQGEDESSTLLTRLEALRGTEYEDKVQTVYRLVFFGDSVASVGLSKNRKSSSWRDLQGFALEHLL